MKSKYSIKDLGPIIILIMIIAGLFSNTLENPFVFDDIKKIVENTDVHDLNYLSSRIFHHYDANDSFSKNDPSRPVISILFALMYSTDNGASWPFHLLSVVIHTLNSILVYLLFKLYLKKIKNENLLLPFLGSILFAILPIQAGTVIYAYGLSDLLCAFFIFLCLYLFTSKESISLRRAFLIYFLFIIGLFSKQLIVVLPLIFFINDFFFPFSNKKIRWKIIGGVSIVAFLYLVLRYYLFGSIGDLEAQGHTFNRWDYLLVQPLVIFKYLFLTVFPWQLAIDHAIFTYTYPQPFFLLAWIFFGMIMAWFILSAIKNRSPNLIQGALLFCAFFYLTLILPVSSVFPTTDALVERRVYGANFALILGVLLILEKIQLSFFNFKTQKTIIKKIFIIGIALCLTGYSVRTYLRNELFSNPEKIWEETLEIYPEDIRALENIAHEYYLSGRYELAINNLKKVLQIKPDWSNSWNNLAVIFGNKSSPLYNLEKAVTYYQNAFQFDKTSIIPIINTAILFSEVGRNDLAELKLREALNFNPSHEKGRLLLIELLILENKFENALKEIEIAQNNLPPTKELINLRERILSIQAAQK